MPTPIIQSNQIAIDPRNGLLYYKDESGNVISASLNWKEQETSSEITTDRNTVTLSHDLIVNGNLTVNGDTATISAETITIEDNILVLNSNVTGAPSTNAGIEVERGTSSNVSLRWNESTDKWEVTNDGTTYYEVLTTGSTSVPASVVTLTGIQTLTNKTLTSPVITGVSPTITLSGDLSGSVTLTNLGNATLNATIANNSVALGTDTTGSYMLDVASGTGISVSHTQSEGSTATVSLNASIDNLSDVVITSAANGQLLEFNGTNWVNAVRPSNEPMGHEDKSESTISFNEGTRTFSIAPVSTSFTVWCAGKRFVKTGTETVEIPDTSGLYYIYYNSSGVLSYRTSFFVWDEDAPTAYVYWNAEDDKAYFFADERHGITLDWATHEYLHRTRGAAIANGFGANNYILNGNGSLDSHAKLDIADGTFFDEDLQVDITHSNTPASNTWQQIIQGNAEIPVFYRVNNHWKKDTATEFPLKQGTSRPQYNLNTAGTWSATDVANNRFGVSWIIATNNLNEPIIAVLGQGSYTDNGSAEAEFYGSLNLDGFPIVEFRPLYKIIYECRDSYSNTPSARFTSIVDLRSIIASDQGIGTTPVSDHGSMTGLSDDDHTQYLNQTRHDALDHSTAMSTVVLNDIGNIDAATPSSDQVLAWDTPSSKWINKTFSASVATLDAVGDVTVPSPSSGDYLKWSGSAWVNDPINLGTDTTGSYMLDITAGTGVSVSHTQGEGSTATLSIGQSVATSDIPIFAGVSLSQNGTLVFEGSTDDNFETTLTVIDPTQDRTISLPNISGTVITTGDTGTVTSTMILNDTIMDIDINTSAAIGYSKLNLSGSITNTDIAALAGIAYSKLSLSNSIDYTDLKDGVAKAGFRSTINAISSGGLTSNNYNLQSSDLAKLVTVDNGSTAASVTIPLSFLSQGDKIDLLNRGTAMLSVKIASGGTLVCTPQGTANQANLRARYSSATLIKLDSSNTWLVIGDLQA
jgi:hypothetical protein